MLAAPNRASEQLPFIRAGERMQRRHINSPSLRKVTVKGLTRRLPKRPSPPPSDHAFAGLLWSFNGGRTRTRTLDPLIKSQLLYQLSYAPDRLRVFRLCVGRLPKRSCGVQGPARLYPADVIKWKTAGG